MKVGNPVVFALALSLSGGLSAAPVYKSVDENGNVVYTDNPRGSATQVDLPPLSTYPAPRIDPPQSTGESRSTSSGSGYDSLTIIQPAPDATLRDNTGQVDVQAALSPSLIEVAGHRFRFYLDGKAMGEPSRTPSASFSGVNRGAHQVEVAVVDAAGNELKRSDSVRFYLHQQSQNFPFGPKPKPNPKPPAN